MQARIQTDKLILRPFEPSDAKAAFAQPVAYGDFITAILALLALATLGTRTGTVLTWVFNIFGTADLLFAFYLGSRIITPRYPRLVRRWLFHLGCLRAPASHNLWLGVPHTATSQGCSAVAEQSTYRLNWNGLRLGKKNRSRVCFRSN